MSSQHSHWTYNDLLRWINKLTPEQRAKSITIHDDENGEFYPIRRCWITQEDDVVDTDSPVITY